LPATVRGPSAKTLLKLSWEYPVYTAPAVQGDGPTVGKQARVALPAPDALAYIAKDDPRPLLVLRECKVCNGTDDALLSRANVDNERTFLFSRWFHCVKLPVDVLQADHPFHTLFSEANPPHMLLSSADGSLKFPLESERSRTELWTSMVDVLKATYAKSPDGSVRKMEQTIDDFDVVDDRIAVLEKRIDTVLENEGPDSKKLKGYQEELASARKEREKLFQAIDQATVEMKLKKVAGAEAAPAEKGGL
jgi:hypothetical protein